MNDSIPEICICVEAHESEYPMPIILSKGDRVKLGERASEPEWHDWIWAESRDGKSGWIPIQIIQIDDDFKRGVLHENYSSKELNISIGSKVVKIKTLNGWSWVRNIETNEEGWLPVNKIKSL